MLSCFKYYQLYKRATQIPRPVNMGKLCPRHAGHTNVLSAAISSKLFNKQW